MARLHDALQQSVTYQVGTIQSVQYPQDKPTVFFTDEAGHFEAADLKAGEYTLRIRALAGYQALITIPEGSFGRLDLGSIQLDALK